LLDSKLWNKTDLLYIMANRDSRSAREQTIYKDRRFADIQLKIDGYRKYNKKISDEMTQNLNVLDEKYTMYQRYLNSINISIILLSSISSFLLAAQPYINNSHAGIYLTTLCVSTYTSLLLSISKFMKLDEKKESLFRMRSEFAEFLIEINSRDDLLESWATHNSWKIRDEHAGENMAQMIGMVVDDFEICMEEWKNLERKLKEQMHDIIIKKQELCGKYAQEMDNKTKFQSELSSRKRMIQYQRRMQELNQESNPQSFINKDETERTDPNKMILHVEDPEMREDINNFC
jgi:hypothetical protein